MEPKQCLRSPLRISYQLWAKDAGRQGVQVLGPQSRLQAFRAPAVELPRQIFHELQASTQALSFYSVAHGCKQGSLGTEPLEDMAWSPWIDIQVYSQGLVSVVCDTRNHFSCL